MSIINKMLQDLDRRQGRADPAASALPQVRSVAAFRNDREWFWRIVAALMVASVAWVAWIAWQLRPRESLVTVQAFNAAENAKRKPLALQAAPAAVPAAAIAVPPPAPEPPAPAIAPAVEAANPAPETIRAAARHEPKPKPLAAERAKAAPAPLPVAKSAAATKLDLDLPPARILEAPATLSGRVQKRDRVHSPEDRAEAQFRRGAALVNEGRVSEAQDAFAAALASSASHEAARQALVALDLEQRRVDDARRLLQEGVALNPANLQFALVLARIDLERHDYAHVLDVLGGARTAGQANPEYHALAGTALQRLGRHAEAAEAFRNALRITPGNGAAWAGLAISLEAEGRSTDAVEAFRRALAAAPAGSALAKFAEQRLRALQ